MNLKKTIAVIIAALLLPVCFANAQNTPPSVKLDSANIVVVELHDGDSILPKLAGVVNSHGIRSGIIIGAIGQVRNFTTGFYEMSLRRYYKKTFIGPYEFATGQGIIARTPDGSPSIDFVAQFDSTNTDLRASNVTYTAIGGHVFGGIVSQACFIVIKRLDATKMERDFRPENGTWELSIGPETSAGNLAKDYQPAGVRKRPDYSKTAKGPAWLFGTSSNAPVFDVVGRRITRLRNGRLDRVSPGMYVVPQRTGKTGVIIKQ
jgi:predicted DNA-binding protein with PD1-like motif